MGIAFFVSTLALPFENLPEIPVIDRVPSGGLSLGEPDVSGAATLDLDEFMKSEKMAPLPGDKAIDEEEQESDIKELEKLLEEGGEVADKKTDEPSKPTVPKTTGDKTEAGSELITFDETDEIVEETPRVSQKTEDESKKEGDTGVQTEVVEFGDAADEEVSYETSGEDDTDVVPDATESSGMSLTQGLALGAGIGVGALGLATVAGKGKLARRIRSWPLGRDITAFTELRDRLETALQDLPEDDPNRKLLEPVLEKTRAVIDVDDSVKATYSKRSWMFDDRIYQRESAFGASSAEFLKEYSKFLSTRSEQASKGEDIPDSIKKVLNYFESDFPKTRSAEAAKRAKIARSKLTRRKIRLHVDPADIEKITAEEAAKAGGSVDRILKETIKDISGHLFSEKTEEKYKEWLDAEEEMNKKFKEFAETEDIAKIREIKIARDKLLAAKGPKIDRKRKEIGELEVILKMLRDEEMDVGKNMYGVLEREFAAIRTETVQSILDISKVPDEVLKEKAKTFFAIRRSVADDIGKEGKKINEIYENIIALMPQERVVDEPEKKKLVGSAKEILERSKEARKDRTHGIERIISLAAKEPVVSGESFKVVSPEAEIGKISVGEKPAKTLKKDSRGFFDKIFRRKTTFTSTYAIKPSGKVK